MDTINNWVCGCGMNSSASGQGPTALCHEEASERSGSKQRLQLLSSQLTIKFPKTTLLRVLCLQMKGKVNGVVIDKC